MERIDEIDQIVRELAFKPFNNFTKVLRWAGDRVPETLGGNCIWFAHQLMGVLEVHFECVRPVSAINGVHFGVVGESGGRRYYMDPSLLLNRALPLNDLGDWPQTFGEGVFKVEASILPDGSLRISNQFSSNRSHIFHMGVDRSCVPLPPLNDPTIARMNGDDGVLLRCVAPDLTMRTLHASPGHSFRVSMTSFDGPKSTHEQVYSRRGDVNSSFIEHAEAVADAVQVPLADLMRMMNRAIRLKSW